MRIWALGLLTLTALSGCVTSQTSTAVDTLKRPAAACAGALAGEDMPTARRDCLPLLSRLEAYAGW